MFTVEPMQVVYPDGPPHYGRTEDTWVINADLPELRDFKDQKEAERVAEILNNALKAAMEGADARS